MKNLSKAERKRIKAEKARQNQSSPEPTKVEPPADVIEQAEQVVSEVTEPEAPEAEKTSEAGTPEVDKASKADSPESGEEGGETEANDLEAILNQLPDNLREKALEQVRKLQEQAERSESSKKWVAFDKALQDKESGLPKIIGDIAEKHGVDLTNRRIVVTYPNGSFNYSNALKGTGSGTKSREGFPTTWGEAEHEGQSFKSPSALATHLGLQITGHRDMVDVFESQGFKVEAEKGKYFRVKKA